MQRQSRVVFLLNHGCKFNVSKIFREEVLENEMCLLLNSHRRKNKHLNIVTDLEGNVEDWLDNTE